MSPEHEEVMMPLATQEALAQAQIHALRQVSDSLASMNRRMDTMGEKLDDVRERVIGLEKSDYDKRLDSLKNDYKNLLEKVDKLESERDQVKGAASFWTWLTKNAPWLLAGLAAFAAGMGFKFK